MKILYLAHRIPYPPNKGDKLRAYRQIEHLAKSHDVWCACFIDNPRDGRYVRPLRDICRGVVAVPLPRKSAMLRGLAGLARGKTVTESFYQSAKMQEALAHWSVRVDFDIVVAFSSGVAPHALSVPARRHVLDLCDLDSRKWQDYAAESRAPLKWLYALEGRRLARREVEWIEQFDASILITEAEATSLERMASQGRLHIVGNGVDIPPVPDSSHTRPNIPQAPVDSSARERGTHQSPKRKRGDKRTTPENSDPKGRNSDPVVGFVGVMDYKPNVDAVVWFVRHCWPGIRRVHPRATFRIVGRNPLRTVSRFKKSPGVRVVGEVESVQRELQRFDVSVAPLQIARGLQNKVLEAMAHAKPVVLTSGAAEGIDAANGEHFHIADSPTDTIQTVNRLLADPEERKTVGQAARSFVATNHDWRRELLKFEQITTGVMASRQSTDISWRPASTAKDIDVSRAHIFHAP